MTNRLLLLTTLLTLPLISSCNPNKNIDYLKRTDWCDNVKNNLNLFINRNKSNNSDSNNYVVFDFDNTSSIFDVEEQCNIYQINHMAYNIDPDKLENVLKTGLTMDASLSPNPGTYQNWIDDIKNAYSNLSTKYGTFTPKGIDESKLEDLHNENDFKDYAAKLCKLYNIISDVQSHNVSYPWITYMFTGMTHDEIYNLSVASNKYYKDLESSYGTFTSATEGKVGAIASIDYINGTCVSENIKELMKQLSENNIKVWICSASNIDVIRGAIDVFGLHDYVTGVLAMTNKFVDGKMINEYDYDAKGVLAKPNGVWEEDTYVTNAQTQGKGKVTAINNALYVRYGKGPIGGFMDSTGDFNFCSEYDSLQLVTCFNRATRAITDGGGLISAVAMYQQDTLKYDLNKAISNGDTLYLLQGREENGLRGFRNSNATVRLNETKETLFKNEDNVKLLNYLINAKESLKTSLDRFAIKTSAADPNNPLGLDYGFLSAYSGYHSIK